MKKKIFLIGALLSFFALTGCSIDKTPVEVKSLPFKNYNEYYDVKAQSLDTYYVDGSLVPYVSLENYIKTMDGLLDSSKYACRANALFKEYVVKTSVSNNNISIIFDYGSDKILTITDNAFSNLIDIKSTIDYSFNLKYQDEEVYPGKSIILDLAKYGFDMRYINGNLLIPFQIANGLFGGLNYNSTYYTGTSYYNFYFSDRYSDTITTEEKNAMKSSVSATLDNEELRKSNYNYLCFYMDYFYGLKELKKFESFDSYISSDIKNLLLSSNPNEYTKGYAKIVQLLNEAHTSIHSYAYEYNGPTISYSAEDSEYKASCFVDSKKTQQALAPLAKEHYGSSLQNKIEIVGDTCYIFYLNFTTGDKADVLDEFDKIDDDAYLYDTYYLYLKAFEMIKNNPTPVKNVVVDLSINGGGNNGAQMRAIGFSSKNGRIKIGHRDSLTNLTYMLTYDVDTNNDGLYDENDGYTNYNWYILTSNYSYSSANLYTHYAKYINPNVKIIGKKAGGGGCAITPMILIDGTIFQISSKNQSITLTSRGTSYDYKLLEEGPAVDYELDYNYYYDRTYLNEFLSELK